jgi:cell division protein FtsQ
MDDRGRCAPSPEQGRSKAPLRPYFRSASTSAARWHRAGSRWIAALTDLDIPKGAGASAAALLLLASACYGAIRGDHVTDIVVQVQDLCDRAANGAGFRITEIAVAGEHEVGRDKLLTQAGITENSSLLFLDAARTRERLLANPWIVEATVLKLYPGRLRIEIKERQAFALWQTGGKLSLIAADGTVLEQGVPARFAKLPQVVGSGAAQAAQGFLALLSQYPTIANDVDASVLVAERRWNLHMKSGLDILLPDTAVERALTALVDLDRTKNILSRDIAAIDLRMPDRITVRQSDAAASQRDEALKAAEKARKAKGKGGEA